MRYIGSLVGVALILAATTTANAAIVLNETGSGLGSASVALSGGTSIFKNPAEDFGPVELSNVIIEKTFESFAPIEFDNVTFDSSDLNFTGGFRWTERIHNDTGVAWTDYHLQLSETDSTWFSDLPIFTPGLVTINGGGGISGDSGVNTVTRIPGDGIIGPDKKELSFFFDTPVASGSFFDLHSAIEGLPSGGSFHLAQAPSVPEPASLIVWGLLGVGCAGGALWRRRRSTTGTP